MLCRACSCRPTPSAVTRRLPSRGRAERTGHFEIGIDSARRRASRRGWCVASGSPRTRAPALARSSSILAHLLNSGIRSATSSLVMNTLPTLMDVGDVGAGLWLGDGERRESAPWRCWRAAASSSLWRHGLSAAPPEPDAGWSSSVARQAHALKAAGPNPAPAADLVLRPRAS